jgi:hypothetical protein
MNQDQHTEEALEHQECSTLLAWYVNGSIGELDRQRVDSHLKTCTVCREDLALERRVYRSMAADAAVEYMPAASLKRLQARLDALETDPIPRAPAARERPRSGFMPWQGWLAASIAGLAAVLSVFAIDWRMQIQARLSSPNYYTVTSPEARPPGEVIRAVFSPTLTMAELQVILSEAQLRIVSGPTEAGVYSLATNSGRPVSLSLSLLRQHTAVRFAEITQPNPRPSASP